MTTYKIFFVIKNALTIKFVAIMWCVIMSCDVPDMRCDGV